MRSDREALLVVDIQNDFCPGGALAVPEGDAIVPLVNRLARGFAHVILTQDWHPAGHASFASSHPGGRPFDTIEVAYGAQILWPDHCVQGTRGAAFHPGLDIPQAELVIRKGFRRGDRFLFGVPRKRPAHARPASPAICASAASTALTLVRAGDRFLRALFGDRRARGRVRRQRSRSTPAAASMSTARSPRALARDARGRGRVYRRVIRAA